MPADLGEKHWLEDVVEAVEDVLRRHGEKTEVLVEEERLREVEGVRPPEVPPLHLEPPAQEQWLTAPTGRTAATTTAAPTTRTTADAATASASPYPASPMPPRPGSLANLEADLDAALSTALGQQASASPPAPTYVTEKVVVAQPRVRITLGSLKAHLASEFTGLDVKSLWLVLRHMQAQGALHYAGLDLLRDGTYITSGARPPPIAPPREPTPPPPPADDEASLKGSKAGQKKKPPVSPSPGATARTAKDSSAPSASQTARTANTSNTARTSEAPTTAKSTAK
jgi:hypothetical protein